MVRFLQLQDASVTISLITLFSMMMVGIGFLAFAIWNKQQYTKNKAINSFGGGMKGSSGGGFGSSLNKSLLRKRR